MFRFTIRDVLAAMLLCSLGLGIVRVLAMHTDSPSWIAIPAGAGLAMIGCVTYLRLFRPDKASWREIAIGIGTSLLIVVAFVTYETCVSDVIYIRL